MSDSNKKLDFGKLAQRKQRKPAEAPKRMYKEVDQVPAKSNASEEDQTLHPAPIKEDKTKAQKKVKRAKRGRRTWKEADVEYVRVGCDLPVETLQQVKVLLATKFYGKYIAQDELINDAINAFLKKHSK